EGFTRTPAISAGGGVFVLKNTGGSLLRPQLLRQRRAAFEQVVERVDIGAARSDDDVGVRARAGVVVAVLGQLDVDLAARVGALREGLQFVVRQHRLLVRNEGAHG